jgi:hypothetical protein
MRIKGVFEMSAIKKEIQEYIRVLPDSALQALKPLLALLIAEEPIVETDLTEEEKAIILRGREEYSKGNYIPLSKI